jgi:hypothetical protein
VARPSPVLTFWFAFLPSLRLGVCTRVLLVFLCEPLRPLRLEELSGVRSSAFRRVRQSDLPLFPYSQEVEPAAPEDSPTRLISFDEQIR